MGYILEEDGATLHKSNELAHLANKARGPLTQEQAANRLGVTKQSISKAEDPSVGSRMNRLRIRMMRQLGGFEVNGPFWVVDTEE